MEEDDSNETSQVPHIVPVKVLYCAVCALPAEYCEFGPNFEKCKPWLLENCPELYPALSQKPEIGDVDEKESEEKSGSSKRGGKGIVKPEKADGEPLIMPGGKVKKPEKPKIHISRIQRNKKKHVTVVIGMEKFGIKLSDASKVFAKKFSCGSSVVKGTNGEDEIDVQGDIIDDMIDFLEEKFNISEDSIVRDDKAKKPMR